MDLIKKMVKVNPDERIKTEEIIHHEFFSTEEELESIPN